MISREKLDKLELFEVDIIEDRALFSTIMRVPGGWIVRSYDKPNNMLSSVFVPWSNEFVPMYIDNAPYGR